MLTDDGSVSKGDSREGGVLRWGCLLAMMLDCIVDGKCTLRGKKELRPESLLLS